MLPAQINWTGVVVGLAVACAGSGRPAGEGRPEDALAQLGLKQAGEVWVLPTESEIRTKLDEAKRVAGQLSRALVQQRGMLSEKDRQAMLKELTGQISQFRSELNTTNQQMRQVPRARAGRYSNYFFNSVAAEQYAELVAYRNQLQAEINQRTAVLDQLKSQPFDPKARQAIDAEVRDRRESLHQAVVDLRRLVEATRAKYAALAQAPEFQKARDALQHAARAPLKLGPSREFLANVKVLDRLEKQDAADGAGDVPAPPARKARRHPAGKRSGKAAAGPASPGSPS
ncbi:MAG TPA: hypothetical protein VFF52_03265 [Isosphaeraceae bacterium]|nr:hypothetical protein [Isosphaeraceae bacterium]